MISENPTKNPWSNRLRHFEGLFRTQTQHISNDHLSFTAPGNIWLFWAPSHLPMQETERYKTVACSQMSKFNLISKVEYHKTLNVYKLIFDYH